MEKKSTYKPNNAIGILEFSKMFPDEDTARRYLEDKRWGGEPYCGHCGSYNISHVIPTLEYKQQHDQGNRGDSWNGNSWTNTSDTGGRGNTAAPSNGAEHNNLPPYFGVNYYIRIRI